MTLRGADRGQPLVMLGVLLSGWIVLRTALWQSPSAEAAPPVAQPPQGAPVFATLQRVAIAPPGVPRERARQDMRAAFAPGMAEQPGLAMLAVAVHEGVPFTGPGPAPESRLLAPPLQQAPAAAPFLPETALAKSPATGRWSADAWLLLREDSAAAATAGRGSYGRSQLGAVLRYHLRPSSAHRPAAYLRLSQALTGARESEAALGLSARPLPRVPVAVAGELRLTRTDGATDARPAAYAATELPPLDLPGGITAEAYLQGGYVGGSFATGFVDGQVRADRKLFDLGRAELRAGGGVWGGVQKGASRLDIGPGAGLRLKIGEVPARVSFDWRFRVAGTAEPESGPALTISAGF